MTIWYSALGVEDVQGHPYIFLLTLLQRVHTLHRKVAGHGSIQDLDLLVREPSESRNDQYPERDQQSDHDGEACTVKSIVNMTNKQGRIGQGGKRLCSPIEAIVFVMANVAAKPMSSNHSQMSRRLFLTPCKGCAGEVRCPSRMR